MNITLSIDKKTVIAARKTAASMGKSLNQIIREDLERLTQEQNRGIAFNEFKELAEKGNSRRYQFTRDKLHERT